MVLELQSDEKKCTLKTNLYNTCESFKRAYPEKQALKKARSITQIVFVFFIRTFFSFLKTIR